MIAGRPPFFIVGAARSGTTLLRVMLDRHPEVAIPPESHFIPRLWAKRSRYGRDERVENREEFLRDLASDGRFRSWDLPIEAVRDELARSPSASFADAVAAAFEAYARRHGKPRWGDKTPRYVDNLPLLAELFPTGRFVHMIRDGRDVALSVLDMARLHTRAATAGRVWARQVSDGRAAGQALGSERYLELRYEDLVEDAEREVRRVAEFLDVPFDPVMLQHEERALERVPVRQRGMHARLALPPTKGLRDWRSQMEAEELAEFEAVAGPELVACGYTLATGPPGVLVRAKARLRGLGFGLRYARGRAGLALRRATGRTPRGAEPELQEGVPEE